jgi:hypothetical protein
VNLILIRGQDFSGYWSHREETARKTLNLEERRNDWTGDDSMETELRLIEIDMTPDDNFHYRVDP